MSADRIRVEVACARAERQVVLALEVDLGTTAAQAVERSGIAGHFPGLDLAACALGVFGRVIEPGQVLRAGDRVEVYRRLSADPKDARRRRAARQKGEAQR